MRSLKLPEDASHVDTERIALWSTRAPDELVDLALKETSRAVMIGYGKTEISERAQAVRKRDLDQATANLRLAIESGFKDLDRIKAHPDAQFVLSRADLKAAIAGLESPGQPKGTQDAESPGKR